MTTRERMVAEQLRKRDIVDARVLDAFARVPRDAFVPAALTDRAYDDVPLPIGHGQTISQPYIVAITAQALALQGHERVLDVGTGSGYAAAILGALAREVETVERIDELAQAAEERLAALGIANVHVHRGDGTLGWPDRAPYDAIAVAAADWEHAGAAARGDRAPRSDLLRPGRPRRRQVRAARRRAGLARVALEPRLVDTTRRSPRR